MSRARDLSRLSSPTNFTVDASTNRVGLGFTDLNFVGSGITITGYGTTVVVDMTSIAAASASGGSAGDDVVRLAIAFG